MITGWAKEIAEYPDYDKVGVLAQIPAKDGGKPTLMRYIIKNHAELEQAGMADYWEGE